ADLAEVGAMERVARAESVLIVGAPLALAILEVFHPHVHDLLDVDVRRWLLVHYAQIPLFALAGLAVAMLVRGRRGFAAWLCRVSMFVFAVSYIAFDTAAGVVTGILVDAAHHSGEPAAWRTAIETVWTHPIVGGSPLVGAPFLAVLGAIALSVGALGAS